MRNHSYENYFDLHENETACRTHFHMKCFALILEKEAQENSEIIYYKTVQNVDMWDEQRDF